MSGPTLAISIDYGDVSSERPERVARIAEILTRPCFAGVLNRASARRGDRWVGHTRATRDSIETILLDGGNDGASLDNGRSGELIASAAIESGPSVIGASGAATRFKSYVAVPYAVDQLGAVVAAVCDLAGALDATAGFVALEPSHGLAHRIAVGGSLPKGRVGLSDQRRRERRARHRYDDRLGDQIANVEWATLLGPGHLERISLDELRASGAFARVTEVGDRLALVQMTDDAMDDLSEKMLLEEKLRAGRAALRPVLMDVRDVSLE